MIGKEALHVFCGKMAAGKSTLAGLLSNELGGIRLSEDELLLDLYSGKVVDIASYVQFSGQIKHALRAHIIELLRHGLIVVLDFPANTTQQRQWFVGIARDAKVHCVLHQIECSDELCLTRLAQRAKNQPERAATDTAEMFAATSQYFQSPSLDEGFKIVQHLSE